jgi:GDPmannose 4,6-dehydratase
MKSALVTGITGQDGFYLTQHLLDRGYRVYGTTSNLYSPKAKNFKNKFPTVKLLDMSLLNVHEVTKSIEISCPNEIYNLAGLSSVMKSFQYPELSKEVNWLGVSRIINAVKDLGLTGTTKIYQASSSEMFGDSLNFPQNEMTPFNPKSPYGISKVQAHEFCKQSRAEGIFVSCGILFNHESPYRGKDFVSKKISRGVAKIALGLENKLSLGHLSPQRDWGFAGDYVDAMWRMLQQDCADDFVIATGKSHSIKDFLQTALRILGLDGDVESYVIEDKKMYRPSEISISVGDASKAFNQLKWKPKTSFEDLVAMMLTYEISDLNEK